ncbi:hypothetical protein OOT46_13995 [Aquabacterium sp. A7-Y]|uniref:hypothetical protein n=1 Tax=Aquabacterium sp. A7-Y TaxID=1349605 RepID=UPI00223CA876|nr:hypothetical protein [Aquabacterium sp. A7-Y]MCW7538953.1 hypothetical protein [Aquabacterium sp. A7-Y]
MLPWLPWFWLCAPTSVRWPFSGDVVQDIAPDTDWFFNAIPPGAGVGRLEKEIFEHASYGRQLGLLMDVVLALAEQASWPNEQAKQRHEELLALWKEIQRLKDSRREALADAARLALRRLESADPERLQQVVGTFLRQ